MASSRQVLLLAVVVAAVACLVSLASATQWTVGDEGGWRAKFNETGWTNDKTFVVGDTLQFIYPKENHTVIMVGKDAFAACDLSANLQLGNWTSGNDVVQLDKPGKVWFICNKPNHCLNGMKLVIDVVDGTTAPAPAPAPSPFPFPGVPAPAPAPLPFPFPGVPTPAPSPLPLPLPFPGVPAPAPVPPLAPPSAAVRNPVGGAVAAVVAAVVGLALAF